MGKGGLDQREQYRAIDETTKEIEEALVMDVKNFPAVRW